MSSVQIDTYTIIDGTGKPIEVALMDVFEKDGIQYASVSEIIEMKYRMIYIFIAVRMKEWI